MTYRNQKERHKPPRTLTGDVCIQCGATTQNGSYMEKWYKGWTLHIGSFVYYHCQGKVRGDTT